MGKSFEFGKDYDMISSLSAATMLTLLAALLVVLVNQTVAPLLFLILYFVLGLILCRILGKHEQRAFGLSFAICVLVTGLSQIYAQVVFGQIQNTIDAVKYYSISTDGIWGTINDLEWYINAPLAVFVWNRLYMLNTTLGFENEPWVGVLFNGFLVGLSAGLTVRTARYVFGSDARRLKLIGFLFATCGIFWLFGAIHIRDSFSLFLNSLLLYGFIRALALPRMYNILLLSIILIFATLAMYYIRKANVLLTAVFCVLGLVSWTRYKKFGGVRLFIVMMLGFMLAVVFADTIVQYLRYVSERAIIGREWYRAHAHGEGQVHGLGYAVIGGQPLFVRLITGSIYMHVFPIPLWNNFTLTFGEYHWIKGYQGFYLATIIPFGVVGIYTALKQTIRGGPDVPPLCFLALFTIITLLGVVATSLETRHHGQFLPAFLILSTLPDRHTRLQLKLCCVIWYGTVVSIHFFWILLKHF